MRNDRGLIVFLAMVLLGSTLQGQGPPRPLPPPFGGIGGAHLSLSRESRHTHFSLGFTRNYGYYSSPYPIRLPVVVPPVTVVQVVQPPPPPPPVFVLIDGRQGIDVAGRRPRFDPEDAELVVERPLPGAAAGGFRPVRPEERGGVARRPAPRPAAMVDAKPPELPRPPQPMADPRQEAERLIALGRQAFAAQEYGRAGHRFSQAVVADPMTALPSFLLGQAHMALGRYDEAVMALQAGLRLRPEWPLVNFRPAELYGGAVEDQRLHRRRLEEALARHPQDLVLLFLQAYQLWFDGRLEDARPLFQKVAAAAPDPSFADNFLKARPGIPPG